MNKLFKILLVIAYVSMVIFCLWGVCCVIKHYQFKNDCSSHMENASITSDVKTAKKELKMVICYANEHGLTEGNSSIFVFHPENDVGYWYQNMVSVYFELENISDEASLVEKNNALMKVREILVDVEGNAIVPKYISLYPYKVFYFLWGVISCAFAVLMRIIVHIYWRTMYEYH